MVRSASQSSIVQNQEFRSKMAQLFSGGSRAMNGSSATSTAAAASAGSSASSTLKRTKLQHRSDLHLDVGAAHHQQQQQQQQQTVMTSSSHSLSSTTEAPVTSDVKSPVVEMKQTIKTGTVGTLIKDKFKNLNLTGRTFSHSAATSSSDLTTEQTSKYKYVIEGIDTTIPLFQDLVAHPDILDGNYDIHWLEHYLEDG